VTLLEGIWVAFFGPFFFLPPLGFPDFSCFWEEEFGALARLSTLWAVVSSVVVWMLVVELLSCGNEHSHSSPSWLEHLGWAYLFERGLQASFVRVL